MKLPTRLAEFRSVTAIGRIQMAQDVSGCSSFFRKRP
jgi:hypothetical protein